MASSERKLLESVIRVKLYHCLSYYSESEVRMGLEKVIVSRQKSIASVKLILAEYDARIAATSDVAQRVVLRNVAGPHRARLRKLEEELQVLVALAKPDDRQVELAGAGSSAGDPPSPGPVTGKGRR